MKNAKTIGIGVAVIIVIGVLLSWGRITGDGVASTWRDSGVACLPGGHANLALHIHPQLAISVNGESERIPANIGITSACMSEVHTHDGSGELHVETTDASVTRTLTDFFKVWGEPMEREGYELAIFVDGELYTASAPIELRDRQRIHLMYSSVAATSTASTTAAGN